MSVTLNTPPVRRSLWIPWVFVGGMLLVVAVNGVLIFSALTTFTGVTTGRSYDRGRQYNQVLEEAARQDALGWQPSVALGADGLAVQVRDREGRPMAGQLAGVLRRPLDGQETPLDFIQAAPGHWLAIPAALRPGQWEARLRLTTAEGAAMDIRQRVTAP